MRKSPGFTLLELVAAIIVLGIIFAAGAPVMVQSATAYTDSVTTTQTLDKLRYATERIARELREVNYSGGTFQFTSGNLSTTAPSFSRTEYMTTSGGAVATNTFTTVVISSSNGNVSIAYTKGGVTTTVVLTDQLSATSNALQFAYYDQTGSSTGVTASTVRYVEIRLILAANGQDYSTRTRVALRNI